MADKEITAMVRGFQATDGAGVRLVRVLGRETVEDFDPFLMLDSFDSRNPADYIAGFPMHPHRGIETITYLISGEIDHQDSLGNTGRIGPGQSQWMTAGSGIIHQEMPQPCARMLGVQLWLNLPRDKKMVDPAYFDIKGDMIAVVENTDAIVRVVSGDYNGAKGVESRYIPATIYDVEVKPDQKITLPTREGENASIFLIEGDALIGGDQIPEKTAVNFGEGDGVTVQAPPQSPVRFLFFMAKPLHEPVAWGGPIVMNTDKELEEAFAELNAGTFIKLSENDKPAEVSE